MTCKIKGHDATYTLDLSHINRGKDNYVNLDHARRKSVSIWDAGFRYYIKELELSCYESWEKEFTNL